MASIKKTKPKKKVSVKAKTKPKVKAKVAKKKAVPAKTSIRDIVSRSGSHIPEPAPSATDDSVDTSSSKSADESSRQRKLLEQESEEKLRAVAVIEGMIEKFQSKLNDASEQLKEAIALAFAIEMRCLRDKSIRDLQLKHRLRVKEMALLAASLDGQIKKHMRRSSYTIPTRLSDIRDGIRQDVGRPGVDSVRESVLSDIRSYIRNPAR